MGKREPEWRKFERLIQEVFGRNPNAKVERDAVVTGKSGRDRKLELWVTYPFEIPFAPGFDVHFDIKIAVDCKDHSKPVGIKKVEEFLGQMHDVGAHAGILVSTRGFDAGARQRAKGESIFLLDTPRDLLILAQGLEAPDFHLCECCREATEDRDGMPGVVDWARYDSMDEHAPAIGNCTWCNAPHIMCPDCAEVVGFHDSEFNKWIECPGGCGRIFHVCTTTDYSEKIEMVGSTEREILIAAAQNGGVLQKSKLDKLIRGTKWQYASGGAHPVASLERRGWITSNSSGLCLTDEGREFVEDDLPGVADSMYGW